MLKIKKLLAFTVGVVMTAALFTACGDTEDSGTAPANDDSGSSAANDDSDKSSAKDDSSAGSSDTSSYNVANFTPPQEGEDIIVMTIKDHGDVKIKLFPEQADKGVENFKGLADKGYYDGLIFHRVIEDFMIQGGDPTGTGMGGECIWGDKFDGGASDELIHAAGAVAYANSGSTATNGSQFYIVTGEKYEHNDLVMLDDKGYKTTDEAKKVYEELGGAPWLDGGYTVFGQVFDGLDIVFDVQSVETDEETDKPVEDLVIEKVSVEKYDGGDIKFFMSDYK